MKTLSFGCGIVTEQLSECKDFYCLIFGFEVASESDWYVQLRSADGKQQIGFLEPSQLSQPRKLQHAHQGNGCWVNIEVENVLQGVMLVTNIYHLIDGSWRLMLHHASPEPRRQKTADNIHVLH